MSDGPARPTAAGIIGPGDYVERASAAIAKRASAVVEAEIAPLLPTVDRREYIEVAILAMMLVRDAAGNELVECLVGERRPTLARKVAAWPVGEVTPAGPVEALEIVVGNRTGRIWVEPERRPAPATKYRVLAAHVEWEAGDPSEAVEPGAKPPRSCR